MVDRLNEYNLSLPPSLSPFSKRRRNINRQQKHWTIYLFIRKCSVGREIEIDSLWKQIFSMQYIERKSHQSHYYISHNGLNHETTFCWFITDCLLLRCAHYSSFFLSRGVYEITKRIYFNSIKHILLFFFIVFIPSFSAYNSALIIQYFHNYKAIISWWKQFYNINNFTE